MSTANHGDSGPGAPPPGERLRAAIESTVLGAGVAPDTVDALCRNAVERALRAVCVPPAWIGRAAERVADTGVRAVTVANFPFGDARPPALEAEARAARQAGADEVDVVFPLHCVPGRSWERAGATLDAFREGLGDLPYKVILETAAWEPRVLDELVDFVRDRGVPTVKTSTGFHPAGGVTPAAVRTLREAFPTGVSIKAAGGIRTRSFALELLDAGADFLGTSSALELLDAEEPEG